MSAKKICFCSEIKFDGMTKVFGPSGKSKMGERTEVLSFEEVEALRLSEVLGLEQKKSARKLGLSQSTFQRLLSSARGKVARAIVLGERIEIGKCREKLGHF